MAFIQLLIFLPPLLEYSDQAWATMPSLCGPGDRPQGFMNFKQAVHQLSHTGVGVKVSDKGSLYIALAVLELYKPSLP